MKIAPAPLTYTLQAACERLRRVVAFNYPQAVWVVAEVAEADVSKGHHFLALVEQGQDGIVAQASAILWASTYRVLGRRLGTALEAVLQPGQQIRLHMRPEIHEQYGLRWLVEDVDTTYTFGLLALQRQQTLRTLQTEQLLGRNRQCPLPPVVQRVAVVSSEEAAGRQDFVQQLADNDAGYAFACTFFQASVQGKNAPPELMAALQRVSERAAQFDCVVLLRGGGARLDLSAFDDLTLCRVIAHMPLPVLTGIGHEIDESVADIVAHTALRTPTAVAAFLLERAAQFEQKIDQAVRQIREIAQQHLGGAQRQLVQHAWSLPLLAQQRLRQAQQQLTYDAATLTQRAHTQLQQAKDQLHYAAQLYEALHPQRALVRGLSWVTQGGKLIYSLRDLSPDVPLTIQVADGQIDAAITEARAVSPNWPKF